MDDLISREETLKAMDTWDKFGCDENCRLIPLRGIDENSYVPYVHYADMVNVVKGMPSAEPVIRCKDCKHNYLDGIQVRFNRCELNHSKVHGDDWFCADAERRTDE